MRLFRDTHSLRTKLTATILLVAIISVALGAVAISLNDISQFRAELSERATLIAQTVGDYSATDIAFGDDRAAADTLAKLEEIPFVVNAHLYDKEGSWFASLKTEPPPSPLVIDNEAHYEFGQNKLLVSTPIEYRNERWGYIQLIMSTDDLRARIARRVGITLGLGSVLAIVALVLAHWLGGVVSKPILDLTNAVQRVAAEPNYTLRVSTSSNDELGTLYSAFNSMLVTLQQRASERNRAQQALAEGEARFAAMFNAISDAVVFADTERRVRLINPAVESMFGYSKDELIGRTTELLYAYPQDYRDQGRRQFRRDGGAGASLYEILYKRKDGSLIWTETMGAQVKAPDGNIIGYLGIIRDITERKHIEEELRNHREHLEELVEERTREYETANSELEAFSYSVSHDLRAPLRSIDGFSQVLLDDYGDKLDANGHQHLERVRLAAQRMSMLIDDLLKLSRVTRQEMHKKAVNLSALAQEVAAELAAREPEREVRMVVQPELTAHGDPQLLKVALDNLLENAWKYTSKKEVARIEFGLMECDGERRFFVRDNGAGFDMQYAHKLFQAFQRLHRANDFPGTGIGLATVARVIGRHGGRIWTESTLDEGATFYFTL